MSRATCATTRSCAPVSEKGSTALSSAIGSSVRTKAIPGTALWIRRRSPTTSWIASSSS